MPRSRLKPIYLPGLLVLGTTSFATTSTWAANGPIAFHDTSVLGTSMDLLVNTALRDDAEKVRSAVLEEIARLSKILSTYDASSDVAKLNATREPVKVAPELIEVLSLYDTWREKSGGAYTGQIGDLKKLWTDAGASGKEPSADELAQHAQAIQKPLWKLDAAAGTAQRLADRKINVDSLGKGYIVSRAVAAAKAKVPDVQGILLNVGGDITATGFSTPGKKIKWTIPVADPANPADNAKPIAELRLSDLSIATSGSGARGFKVDGSSLSHIIDPRTGRPVGATKSGKPARNGVASATVTAPDNATANALATSICVLGVEEGLKLVKSMSGAECLIVLNAGGRVRSDGFKKFEIPRADEGSIQSTVAGSDGEPWPAKYTVDIDVPVKPDVGRGERPYVAVWIEDDQQQHVTTLAVWGDDERWLRQMDYWSKILKGNPKLFPAVTRPTRNPGHYTLVWNGTDRDGQPVPQGKYTVWVEVSHEHGARAGKSAVIDCGDAPAHVKLDATDGFEPVKLDYVTKQQ